MRWVLHICVILGFAGVLGDTAARAATDRELDLLVTLGHPPSEVFRGADGARRLLDIKGVVHLQRLQFETESIKSLDVRKSRKYQRQARRLRGLALAYEEAKENGFAVRTYMQWNPSIGDYDVLAAAPIAEGTLIGEFTGIVRPLDTVEDASRSWLYPVTHSKADEPLLTVVDASRAGNELRFLRQGNGNNVKRVFLPVGAHWRIVFVAIKDIGTGSPLVVEHDLIR